MSRTFSKISKNVTELFRNRQYLAVIIVTAVFSYGFLITHGTVGIDDTPYALYFEEGLNVIVGRWVLFIVNKFLAISEYAPFLTDLAGVMILVLAVTVWAGLFRSICRDSSRENIYLVFAAVFLSCPLISEVYTYHLHNGISLGYLFCGVSLWFFRDSFDEMTGEAGIRALRNPAVSLLCLWAAIGCYESFLIVWMSGVCFVLAAERANGFKRKMFRVILTAGCILCLAVVLRTLARIIFTAVFGLGYMNDSARQRSAAELFAWMMEEDAYANFGMAVKRFIVMYGAFAYAYLPIRVFVAAVAVILIAGCVRSIIKRDVWILILNVGGLFVCTLLMVVEGKVTLYRSAQFLPFICGYGAFVAAGALAKIPDRLSRKKSRRFPAAGKLVNILTFFLFGILLWNQCSDMNRWFYIDYLKYEDAKKVTEKIYQDLAEDFDLGKPVFFAGVYNVPRSIIEDAYVPLYSETFFKINRITGAIDEHLLEKFYRSYGVWVAQTPALSVIDWARYAFGDDSELVRFFAMHGYTIRALKDVEYTPLEMEAVDMPHYPDRGYIRDMGEYIVVHF